MPAFTRLPFSAATDGNPIALGTTSTALHTATADTTGDILDEVHVWVHNSTASAVEVTMEIDGTAYPSIMVVSIPAKSTVKVVDGSVQLYNAGTVQAKAASATTLSAFGWVRRIDQSA